MPNWPCLSCGAQCVLIAGRVLYPRDQSWHCRCAIVCWACNKVRRNGEDWADINVKRHNRQWATERKEQQESSR